MPRRRETAKAPPPANDPELARSFDPTDLPDGFYEDPFPTYRALRVHDPVHRCPDGSYFLSRYEDLHRVYRDASRFSSDKHKQFGTLFGEESPLYEHHTTSLVFSDPPLHTHVRKAIGNALSARAVAAMEQGVHELVSGLLDRIEDRETFDLVEDYAGAIPVAVIGNLLRVPHDERGPLREWSRLILGALEPKITPEAFAAGNRAVTEFVDYLDRFIAERRKNLTDDHDDILSRLIQWESDGFRLSPEQLFHQCIFLLNAGHETTTNLIGNGVHALLSHPEELSRLKADRGLVRSAVEELLRFESPNQLGNRLTTEGVEIGGVEIPAGTVLTLCIGGANRDPEVFPDPDRLDVGRSPNHHLAFAYGPHICAGNNVGRLEARIAIEALFTRFPGLRLDGEPVRARRARFRSLVSLRMATG